MQEDRLWTTQEVEELLETQKGNCYVAIYNNNPKHKDIASLCVKAPFPASFSKSKEKKS